MREIVCAVAFAGLLAGSGCSSPDSTSSSSDEPDESLPPGSIDAFCREAQRAPFGTPTPPFDAAAWAEGVEDIHVAAPVDLREETQALLALEARLEEPEAGALDLEPFYDLNLQLVDACGINVDDARMDSGENDQLYDLLEDVLGRTDGLSYGPLLGHIFIAAPELDPDTALAVCESVTGFRDSLPNPSELSIVIATGGESNAAVVAWAGQDSDCTQ